VLEDLTKDIWGICLSSSHTAPVAVSELNDDRSIEKLIEALKLEDKVETFSNYFHECFQYYKLLPVLSNVSEKNTFKLKDGRKNPKNSQNIDDWGTERISCMSFGTKLVFYLLYKLCLNKLPLVSIEELENGLHPTLFWSVINAFRKLMKDSNTEKKLIITTHNPAIVNRFENALDAIYIGLPSKKKAGQAKFSQLSDIGIQEIREMIKVSQEEPSREGLEVGSCIFTYCLMDLNAEVAEDNGWFKSGVCKNV
jgi:hypothetical protein